VRHGTGTSAHPNPTGGFASGRGKTVEVGRAHFESASKRYTILDAPYALTVRCDSAPPLARYSSCCLRTLLTGTAGTRTTCRT
jgi:hypothetical protein